MKRLLAATLAAALLLVGYAESFHSHASAHKDSCAACNLEMRAAGVTLHAPQLRAPVRCWFDISNPAPVSPSAPVLAAQQARSPPFGA